jgi:hypothetical protein
MRRIILSAAIFFAFNVSFLTLLLAEENNSPGGLCAIWDTKNNNGLKLPYISAGQVVVQWADVEPQEGKYEFERITELIQPFQKIKRKVTLQINGFTKPSWLFEKVPSVSEKLHHSITNKEGTLMYWHPAFVKAYVDLLSSYAQFLKDHPDIRQSLLGIRLNFNAIGTEQTKIAPKYQDPKVWKTPKGVEPGIPWTEQVAEKYEETVIDAFVNLLSSQVFVFCRNNLDENILERKKDLFESGKLGFFHTSSEAEPRSSPTERQYKIFYDFCRSGKTLAYSESWATAWGFHGGEVDDRWCSPTQWNYWRLLFDLHCGVSWIAIYGSDLELAVTGKLILPGNLKKPAKPHDDGKDGGDWKSEYDNAFRFAAKYAGFHTIPEKSPGAWVAFRENHEVLAENRIPSENRKLSFFTGDYDFLMSRNADSSRGIHNAGPEDQRYGAWARVLSKGETMSFGLEDRFAQSIADKPISVSVIALIPQGAKVTIDNAGTSYDLSYSPSASWQRISTDLPSFKNLRDSHNSQLAIRADKEVTLHMIEVERR